MLHACRVYLRKYSLCGSFQLPTRTPNLGQLAGVPLAGSQPKYNIYDNQRIVDNFLKACPDPGSSRVGRKYLVSLLILFRTKAFKRMTFGVYHSLLKTDNFEGD